MKKILIITLILVLFATLLPVVSAFEFDNVKSYNPSTREVTIKNSIMKLVPLGEVAKIKPLSPQVNYVIDRGEGIEQLVYEFEITNNVNDYSLPFKSMEFYDNLRNGKIINKEITYKYRETYYITIEDYNYECKTRINEEGFQETYDCEKTLIGTHQDPRYRWHDLDISKLPEGNIVIGLFTDVEPIESIEFVPTWFGLRIPEFATWTNSLNNGLQMYYSLDDYTSGTSATPVLDNATGLHNGTFNATSKGAWFTPGILGSSINFSESANDNTGARISINNDSYLFNTSIPFSVQFWIYEKGTSGNRLWITGNAHSATQVANPMIKIYNADLAQCGGADAPSLQIHNSAGANLQTCVSDRTIQGAWQHWVITYTPNPPEIRYYINGSLSTLNHTINMASVNDGSIMSSGISIGGSLQGRYAPNALLDEIGIWHRILTPQEISDLYNNGNGIAYQDVSSTINVTLINPPIGYTSNLTTVTFNCTGTTLSSGGLINLTLIIDNIANYSIYNTTAGQNLTLGTVKVMNEGLHNYTCYAEDDTFNGTAAVRTFAIDSTPPSVRITYPSNNSQLFVLNNDSGYKVGFTTNVIEILPDSCWYYNGTANISIARGSNCTKPFNVTFFPGEHKIMFYLNDTLNNLGYNSTKFFINNINSTMKYDNPVLESTDHEFAINVTYDSSYFNRFSSEFNYNNTANNITRTSPNNFVLRWNVTSPLVSNSSTKIPFYWNNEFVWINSSGTFTQVVTAPSGAPYVYYQNITNFLVGRCPNYTNPIFNFTMYDETTQAKLVGATSNTSIKLYFTIKTASGTNFLNYSGSFQKINPVAICTNATLDSSVYRLDGVVEYSSDTRFIEFYNFQNYRLSNATDNLTINLYNLNDSVGQEFKITYKDSNFVPVNDALIAIQRNYVDEGVYKTVELPKTGGDGYTVGHLVRNDVIYTLVVSKEGVILATFPNIIAECQNPGIFDCVINLNSYSSGSMPEDYNYVDDLAFTAPTYNYSTRVVSSYFTVVSGINRLVSLNATLFDRLGNNSICSNSLFASSGTLSCTVPISFGNGTLIAKVYKSGQLVGQSVINLANKPSKTWGYSQLFIILVAIFLIAGIAIVDDPMVYGIIFSVGIIAIGALNLFFVRSWVGAGATILFIIIGIILLLIKGSNRT